MKKAFRLKKSADFKKVLDHKHCLGKNDSVSVFSLKNDLSHARVGISASSKIGNAVCRARIRRQLRVQISSADIYQLPYDIVVIARKGYLEKTFQENSQIVNNILQKLKNPSKGERK